MSKYSQTVDGKVLDFRYKSMNDNNTHYAFYIGDIYVGQIFKFSRRSRTTWTSVGATPSDGLCPVNGFATRHHAAEFLLCLEGYNRNG